jgi:hypothetical protein
MKFFKSPAGVFSTLIFLLACGYVWLFYSTGTDVKYQSSNMQWADSEMSWKGRDLDVVLFNFYLYKLNCSQPNLELQRITPKPNWYNFEHWFNDYSEPKWQIPIGTANDNTKAGHYLSITEVKCNGKGVSPAVLGNIEKQRKLYIDRLRKNT